MWESDKWSFFADACKELVDWLQDTYYPIKIVVFWPAKWIHQMLKHMLTQTPSLPNAATAAAATAAAKTTTAAVNACSSSIAAPCGPNFKLASRANQQNSSSGQMLDTADAHLDVS